MAFALHQNNSTARQDQSATDTMTSASFATSLLHAGKLTPADHETFLALINRDINAAPRKDTLTLSVTDHNSIDLYITHRHAEALASVFNTAELLEAILLCVPAKNLILDIPLVCKGFREAMQTSKKLQRRMYAPLDPGRVEAPNVFGVRVPGFKFWSEPCEFGLSINTETMKPSACYHALRSRQLSDPVAKSATLEYIVKTTVTHVIYNYVSDCTIQSGTGITFGDILDIVDRDERGISKYCFTWHNDFLHANGRSSDDFVEWMAGGELKTDGVAWMAPSCK